MFCTDNFITNADEPEEESTRRNHALLNRNFAADDKSPEEIANAIVGRHRDRPAPYTGDMSEIPQRLLMPSVHDASLWQVRVKVCLGDLLCLDFSF
jgi:transcription elongation factor SPT5